MIILQNLITTNHRKNGKSKDDLKLTELDVLTMRGYANPVPCKRGLTVIYYIFKLQFRITEHHYKSEFRESQYITSIC